MMLSVYPSTLMYHNSFRITVLKIQKQTFTKMKNLLKNNFLALLALLLLASCNEEEPAPDFQEPPEGYRLKLVRTEYKDKASGDIVVSEFEIEYNNKGLVMDSSMEYDDQHNLIRSDWGGRPYIVNYTYENGKLVSAISDGHFLHKYEHQFSYHSTGELTEVKSKMYVSNLSGEGSDEWTLNSETIYTLEYEGSKIIIKSVKTFLDDEREVSDIFIYELDNGHDPYPKEERFRQGFWPFNLLSYVADRNILSITEVDTETNEKEIVASFSYEYNEFGYPITKSSESGVSYYYEYAIQ